MSSAAILNMDLNAKTTCGNTGFHFACKGGHIKMANLMMSKAANLKLDIKNNRGETGFDTAKRCDRATIMNLIIFKGQN